MTTSKALLKHFLYKHISFRKLILFKNSFPDWVVALMMLLLNAALENALRVAAKPDAKRTIFEPVIRP